MAQWHTLTAADVMSTPATTLHQSTSLLEAARTLSDNQISGAPVVGAYGAAVGLISLYDIVGYLANHEGPVANGSSDYGESDNEADESGERFEQSVLKRGGDILGDTTVDEIMTGDLIAVTPETPLPEVIEMMKERRIHRVVVASDSRPVGIVSTLDVLRGVALEAPSS